MTVLTRSNPGSVECEALSLGGAIFKTRKTKVQCPLEWGVTNLSPFCFSAYPFWCWDICRNELFDKRLGRKLIPGVDRTPLPSLSQARRVETSTHPRPRHTCFFAHSHTMGSGTRGTSSKGCRREGRQCRVGGEQTDRMGHWGSGETP